jgi:hypothetical protein
LALEVVVPLVLATGTIIWLAGSASLSTVAGYVWLVVSVLLSWLAIANLLLHLSVAQSRFFTSETIQEASGSKTEGALKSTNEQCPPNPEKVVVADELMSQYVASEPIQEISESNMKDARNSISDDCLPTPEEVVVADELALEDIKIVPMPREQKRPSTRRRG